MKMLRQVTTDTTGKSLSEALIFAEHGENMYWTCNSMSNLLSYCGLVDAKIWASDKDLPVPSCKLG